MTWVDTDTVDQALVAADQPAPVTAPVRQRSRTAYIDVETATQSAVLIREIAGHAFIAPSDMLAWCAENAGEQALNPVQGQIIAWALVTSDGVERVAVDRPTLDQRDERPILVELLDLLDSLQPGRIVAWNGILFDFPFLRYRGLACGLPALARWFHQVKKWDGRLVDPSEPDWFPRPWKNDPKSGWKWSLDTAAEMLGISRPPTVPGAQIPAAWYQQRFDDVAAHVLDDAQTLRLVTPKLAAGRRA